MIDPIDTAFVVPVVLAIVAAFKALGLPSKIAPFLSIILGMAIMSFFGTGETNTLLLNGLIAGLTASGLYSGAKTQLK